MLAKNWNDLANTFEGHGPNPKPRTQPKCSFLHTLPNASSYDIVWDYKEGFVTMFP